jgi:hypothetical protein
MSTPEQEELTRLREERDAAVRLVWPPGAPEGFGLTDLAQMAVRRGEFITELTNVLEGAEARLAMQATRAGDELFAWMGEGMFGVTELLHPPAGFIPVVATTRATMERNVILVQLQQQANTSGKPARLARYRYVEDVITITPTSATILQTNERPGGA